jgi:hypothetical protein
MLGHWTVSSTMRYVRPSATFIEDAYRRAVSGTLGELGPVNWHIVLKPGQAAGRRFGSQPTGPLKRYDQHRSASMNN